MTKSLKIIPVVIMLIMLFFPIKSEASSGSFSFDQIISQGDDFLRRGEGKAPIKENDVANIILPIGQFLVGIGIFVMVVVVIIMGIKYMSADPNTQAKLKQQMIGVVVAGIVIFGAYGIWRIVYNFMDGLL